MVISQLAKNFFTALVSFQQMLTKSHLLPDPSLPAISHTFFLVANSLHLLCPAIFHVPLTFWIGTPAPGTSHTELTLLNTCKLNRDSTLVQSTGSFITPLNSCKQSSPSRKFSLPQCFSNTFVPFEFLTCLAVFVVVVLTNTATKTIAKSTPSKTCLSLFNYRGLRSFLSINFMPEKP